MKRNPIRTAEMADYRAKRIAVIKLWSRSRINILGNIPELIPSSIDNRFGKKMGG
jgi:hypothetical protein